MAAFAAMTPARSRKQNDNGTFIGGVFCGREIAPGIWAEEMTSRRHVIRHKTEPNFAKRVGGGLWW